MLLLHCFKKGGGGALTVQRRRCEGRGSSSADCPWGATSSSSSRTSPYPVSVNRTSSSPRITATGDGFVEQ